MTMKKMLASVLQLLMLTTLVTSETLQHKVDATGRTGIYIAFIVK